MNNRTGTAGTQPGQVNGDSRVIDPRKGARYIADGWAAADLHVHSWYSYDVLPLRHMDPLAIYQRAYQKGFRFITFTDHDTMAAYDRIGWTRERIVPGVELKILDSRRVGHTIHVNVYQLTLRQFQNLREIADKSANIELFLQFLREHNLPHVFNHPFWHEPWETPNLGSIINVAAQFPAVEYNSGRVDVLNKQALELARLHDRGVVAGSDTHIGAVGITYTLARASTFETFFQQIVKGRSLLVGQDMNNHRLTHEVLVRIRHLFDRSGWQFEKPGFSLETGLAWLDRLVRHMVSSQPESHRRLKSLTRLIFHGIASSGIPAALYIRSQRVLGEKTRRLIHLVGSENAGRSPQISAA